MAPVGWRCGHFGAIRENAAKMVRGGGGHARRAMIGPLSPAFRRDLGRRESDSHCRGEAADPRGMAMMWQGPTLPARVRPGSCDSAQARWGRSRAVRASMTGGPKGVSLGSPWPRGRFPGDGDDVAGAGLPIWGRAGTMRQCAGAVAEGEGRFGQACPADAGADTGAVRDLCPRCLVNASADPFGHPRLRNPEWTCASRGRVPFRRRANSTRMQGETGCLRPDL